MIGQSPCEVMGISATLAIQVIATKYPQTHAFLHEDLFSEFGSQQAIERKGGVN